MGRTRQAEAVISNLKEKEKVPKKSKIIKNKFKTFSLFLALILILGILFFGVIFPNTRFTGLFTQNQNQSIHTFSQNINLDLNQSTTYEWVLENSGQLNSVKLNGLIELKNNSEVKIFLNNLLIFDSSKLKAEEQTDSTLKLTGSVIEGTEQSNESYSETETPLQEESSPSQEESLTENQTIENIEILELLDICEETCDLEQLNLTNSSYNLRIEISNAELKLNSITYEIIQAEEIAEEAINTTQYPAVLGQPVKWKKEIPNPEKLQIKVELPKEAENIIVNKITQFNESYSETEAPLQEESSPSQEESLTETNKRKERAKADIETKGKQKKEYIEVSIDDNATFYEIEYETPAPSASEENITNGKRVKITSPEDVHYENVLIFTNLSEDLMIIDPSKIKVYWVENETYISIQKIEDKDNNGIYDYIEWIAPHLSNQTFEIILITKAEHLDESKNFISNIYEEVKDLDGIWSEEIQEGEYVRVTFEIPLDSTRDITLFPRIISGNPSIEVYEKDGTEKIAEFISLTSDDYNKVYLTNLQSTQDTFDLRVVGGEVQFDYIVDPWGWTDELMVNGGFEWGNLTGWTTSGAYWQVGNVSGGEENTTSINGSYSAYTSSGTVDGYIYQDVNVSSYSSYIDSGNARVNASGWRVSAELLYDYSRIQIIYLFENLTEIETAIDSGYDLIQPWERIGVFDDALPNGTRYIRVWGNTYEPSYPGGSLDSFSVRISTFTEDQSITTTLINPSTGTNATSSDVEFSVNSTSSGDAINQNVTLYIWHNNGTLFLTDADNLYGKSNITNWTKTLNTGEYIWNAISFANDSNSSWGTSNRTIGYHISTLKIIYPTTGNYLETDSGENISVYFNYSIDGQNITSGISIDSVFIGGINASILGGTTTSRIYNASNIFENNSQTTATNPPSWTEGWVVARNATGYNAYWNTTISDNINYTYSSGGSNVEVITRLNFTITESLETITSITLIGEFNNPQSGGTGEMVGMHVANWSSQSWEAIGTQTRATEATQTITYTNSDSINNIIRNGQIVLLFEANDADNGETLQIDHAEVIVNSTSQRQFAYISNIGWNVNVTVPSGLEGYQNLFVNTTYSGNLRNDTQTNAILVGTGEDTTPPTYNSSAHNSTLSDSNTLFSIYINDNFALNPNGQYIFSTNNTGTWINDTAVNFTSTPQWANVTKTLNSTDGTTVGYRWYFNDSAGNTNSTNIYTLTTEGELDCSTLSSPNTVYTLTQNVSSQGTCFTIDAENVTLDCNNYWINYSTDGGSNEQGIFLNEVSGFTVRNCNIVDGNFGDANEDRYGIFAIFGYNHTIFNNTITTSYSSSIMIDGLVMLNLSNNTLFSNESSTPGAALALTNISYANIVNNNLTNNIGLGFDGYFYNSNFSNNNIYTNSTSFYSLTTENSTLSNNILTSINGYGMSLNGYINNILSNNKINAGYFGIWVASSSNQNTFINNSIASNESGLTFYESGNNVFINSTVESFAGDRGVWFYSSDNISVIGSNILCLATGCSAVHIQDSNNLLFRDCMNITGNVYDVENSNYGAGGITNVTLINCTYNSAKEYSDEGNDIIRKWYYQAYTNYTNGTEVAGANISAYNTTGQLQFTALTNSSGWIQRQEVTEYINTGVTISYFSNYTIFANKSGAVANDSNILNITITLNKLDDIFTLEEASTVDCATIGNSGTLDNANTIYTLTSNVSSQGTCFTITQPNITLDCNGYWINYSISGGEYERGVDINEFNATIKNCNIIDGNFSYISGGETREGIYVEGPNCTLFNNSVTTNTTTAIFVYDTSNFTNLTRNNVFSGNNAILVYSSHNTLVDNTGNSTAMTHWYCAGIGVNGEQNTLINNTAGGTGYALSIAGEHNLLVNNTAISTLSTAILIQGDNHEFINQIAEVRGDGAYGLSIAGSSNNTFRDCINISGNSEDVDIGWDPGSINNTFINCSVDTEFIPIIENWFISKWYYQAYVNNTAGSPVSNANISAYDSTGQLQFTALTNSSGWISRQEITDYNATRDGRVYYSNYTLFANKSGAVTNDSNIINVTNTQNKLNDFFTIDETASECTTLNTAGQTYTLNSNVSSTGTCFTIAAANVTLDCNNYWINYSTGGTYNTYGVYTNQFNTTIRNCNIVDGNWSSSAGSDRIGIYFNTANNGTIFNNYVEVNNSQAIFLEGASNFNNVTNNSAYSGLHGIDIQGNNNYISNNLANSSGVYYSFSSAIIIYGGQNNILLNNTLNARYTGFSLFEFANNTQVNNLIINTYGSYGTHFENSYNNTFTNFSIEDDGNYGILLTISANNTFKDGVIVGSGLYDVATGFDTGSLNNTFVNCSYNIERINGASNQLLRKWYYQAYTNYSNGTEAAGANISAYNTTGQLQFTELTNSSGWIQRQEVTEYVNTGGTRSYYNNYTINATLTGYTTDSNIFNFTTTQNKLDDVFTLLEEGEDTTTPSITFEEPPTPANASTVYSPNQTIVANISDNSAGNTSSWIDFDRSLIGYWSFDYYNATGMYDNSTYNNFGIFAGGLNYSNLTTGVRGNALTFDGQDDYVNINNIENMGQQFTVSLWNRLIENNSGYSGGLFFESYNWGAEGGDGFGIYQYFIEGGGVYTYARIGNYSDEWNEIGASLEYPVPINTWRFYTVVWNYPYLTTYVNGELSGNESFPHTFNTTWNDINIGSLWFGTNNFNGSLDEVMIFNRSISDTEILALYNSQANKFNTTLTDLSLGKHNYTVYAIDEAGNRNNSGEKNFILEPDTTPPTVILYSPTGTISDVTPLINISSNETGTIWYNIDNGTNITLCTSCNNSQNTFLYLEEGTYTIYIFANDTSGNLNNTVSSQFTINMANNYYDNFNDNSSVQANNNLDLNLGNISFTGSSNYLDNPNLVSVYEFENSGNLGLDTQGNNNMSSVGDPAQNTTVPPGFTGYSIELDGDDQICNYSGFTFDPSLDHTMCFWVMKTDFINDGNVFAQNCVYDTWDTGYDYVFTANNCYNPESPSIENVFSPNQWVHICQTYDSTTDNMTFYINGNENSSHIFTNPIEYHADQAWCIGGCNGGCWMTGNVFEPMWFDQMLTSEEIFSIYSNEAGYNSGNFTSYPINITQNITEITNITWTEINTDTNNNITVQVSVDGGITWYVATSGSALGQTFTGENNSVVYRVLFATNSSTTITISDMNISWSGESQIPGENVCGTLDSANTVYTLTQNISSTGTCFDITAENITLDCAGYWINYSIGGEANTYGVYTYNTNNLTIKNCNIVDGNWSSTTEYSRVGIELNDATNGTIFNNTIRVNNSYGLYLYNTANYNNLTANTVFSNTSLGIILDDNSAYNTLMNNTASSNGDAAIFLYQYSDNNTLIANNATSRFAGCFIYLAGNNNLSNNTCRNIIGIDYGLYLYDAYNNLFVNNTAFSESGTATQLGVSLNNTFIKHTSIVSGSGYYSLSLSPATNNTIIRDCVNISGPDYHITTNGNSINNTLINCSYDSESIDDASSQLIRKWYYQAYTNYTNGTEVAGANISAYNTTGQIQFTTLTNSSGWIQRQEITEYVNTGGTRSYYNNYTINSTLSGYDTDSNILNFTTTQNKLDDVFTLTVETTGPADCTTIGNSGTLDSVNTIYTLTENISSQGTCLTVSAENVTIDCAGYWINYSIEGGENQKGVYSNQFNTTIKNCNIIDGNWTAISETREGIYLGIAPNSTLFNNTVTTNTTAAIIAYEESNFLNLTKNKALSGAEAIFILSNNNILINNIGNSTAAAHSYSDGIGIGGEYNQLINNTAGGAGYALDIIGNNTYLINNTAISTGSTALLIEGNNNEIINQIAEVRGNGEYAIGFTAAYNNLLRDCINISGETADVYYESTEGSVNNTFINCSYDTELVQGAGNELIRKWYYQAYTNYSNGTEVAGANISAYNTTGQLQFTGLTNSSGLIDRQEVIEYINTNNIRSYYNNYTINATLSGYDTDSNEFNFTITQNKIDDFFTLSESPDTIPPTITFEEPPTPENSSSITTSNATIVANISDASNTSSWIDFDRSLVGYWSMDYYNTTGIYDNSSYGNNGTFQGGLNYSNLTTGARGQGLEFDGYNDYISIQDNESLQITGNISISSWVKFSTSQTNNPIVAKWGGEEKAYVLMVDYHSNNQLSFIISVSGSNIEAISSNTYNDGLWHNVVGVFNGSNVLLYIDGDSERIIGQSTTGPVDNLNLNLSIGCYTYPGSHFNGSIDEVMIFNRTLSQTEILALYNSQSNKFNTTLTDLSLGQHNYTVYAIDESGNYNTSGERNFVVESSVPQIYSVTPISDVTLTEGPSPTFLEVNFSVYDANGASNLNSSTASINFTKSGEELRYNSSCVEYESSGNYANYTCNITMWWFDGAGDDWKIYANISDVDSNLAINDTLNFTVNTLTGFVVDYSSLNFATLVAGSHNQTPVNHFTLNNTGNVDITLGNIEVNATDLVGETTHDKFLLAGNFSASPYTGNKIECNVSGSATALSNYTFTGIENTILPSGNYTVNDGTGQEQIYFCLREVGIELTQQQYSTDSFGTWTIRIVLVALSVRRKKKKQNSEKYSNLTIPATIFTKKLGALESTVKYMKENLGLAYHTIAEMLNRDERTVWTAYNKSIEKYKETIAVKETEIFIPLSILNNRKLTILESVIVYLRNKDMTYSEIGRLIDRDQRNVRSIYMNLEEKSKEKQIIISQLTIPATIFTKKLGALESTVKYMKENLGLAYHTIAEMLNRDERTVWTAYNKSIEKYKETIAVKETEIFLPISVLNNRELTVLESVIYYLRNKDMKYSEIGRLINRNQRNVRTIYCRTNNKK